ncbi:TetR/AcrR family transcriptional regulator [Paraglaciecola aquimarina]|uniref:TetR/AcrR family transcriptional regulator n=1 Tax=Paraglaciecola aquimarina TaxID=1235557 RepID=A0ABU3SY17_9ALTE|nr:TetR/AcrR family transcriptional regulator [Paraglaciecola aquimarina]MDU0354907.1 TetR/AcrR family transcriptional regulator [Paraglaciecola aquimarina]
MLLTASQPPSSAKQRILFAAHDLFYSKGIRATGVDLIIAQAKVTKTTFYRHFASKNLLILAYLDYRHQIWLTWFSQHINSAKELVNGIESAITEWFSQDYFRGCAFINSLSEIAQTLPTVKQKVAEHKRDVAALIMTKLPASTSRHAQAQAIVMAIDGAIIRVQSGEDNQHTIALLATTVTLLSNQK